MVPTEKERKTLDIRRRSVQALGRRERNVLHDAVRAMAAGGAPTVKMVSRETRLPVAAVREALASLEAADLVALDRDRIRVAYPFTTDEVPHEVVSSRGTARANCVVDALGAGAMLDEKVEIRSLCPYCGASIRLRGRDSFTGTPPRPVVFLPPLDTIQGHAADCLCPSINFYCNEEHGTAHLGALAARGRFLSLKEAAWLGINAFADLLGPGSKQSGKRKPTTKG